MRPLRLQTRMFAWFMAIATGLVVVAGAVHAYELREALLETLDHALESRAVDLAARYAQGQPLEPERVAAGKDFQAFEIHAAGTGSVIVRSASLSTREPILGPERVREIAAHRRNAPCGTHDVQGLGRLRVFAQRVPALSGPGDGAGFVVVVAQDLREIEDELRDSLSWSAVTLGIAIGMSAVAAWLAARHLTRPLRGIAGAAKEIESAGVARPIPRPGAGDEVDELAVALERAFARLQDALERQARFASDAAHELRTPVAAILAQAEVARRRERTTEEYRSTLDAVVGAARRMQETLDALLLVARGDSDAVAVARGHADLAAVAREAAAATADAAASGQVGLHVVAPDSAPLAGDPRLLGILVRNLLENAVLHSPPGATVDVEVSVGPPATTLRVTDRGAGIPAEALPHVFERFFRADPSRSRSTGGSGLGLALVRQIATSHGGTASIESTLGAGTSVTVRFPTPEAGRPGTPGTG